MDAVSEAVLRGARAYGIGLTENTAAKFSLYYERLEQQNRVMNLTAITDSGDAARLHFLDSLALFRATDFKSARIIDIGSGAGFPGIPIKLAEPSADLTLLDATGKRIDFLRDLCRSLELDGVSFLHSRAEDAALLPELRDSFDIAVSRAVARLNVLCELCLPFVRVGGLFLAMKGASSSDETAEAANAVTILAGELLENVDYLIPDTDVTHRIVVIRKTCATPNGYPRRFSRIQKSPL